MGKYVVKECDTRSKNKANKAIKFRKNKLLAQTYNLRQLFATAVFDFIFINYLKNNIYLVISLFTPILFKYKLKMYYMLIFISILMGKFS